MKKRFLTLAVLCTAISGAFGATSSLLIQGPFGPGGAVETYKWNVLYVPGSLSTGLDLLGAVFGVPADTGTTRPDPNGALRPYHVSGNAMEGVGYLFYSDFGALLVQSFTLDGVPVVQAGGGNPAWSYYVAGGNGQFATSNFTPGSYPDGSWNFSNDGFTTRGLSDGSFDGWVFGPAFPDPSPTIATFSPFAADFSDAQTVATPEPGTVTLLLVGMVGILTRRQR